MIRSSDSAPEPCPTCKQPLGSPCDRAVHSKQRRTRSLDSSVLQRPEQTVYTFRRRDTGAARLRALLEVEGEATCGLIAEEWEVTYATACVAVRRALSEGWVQAAKVPDPSGKGRAVIWYSLAKEKPCSS